MEAPAAGKTESLGAALDEEDHLLRIAGDIVANPEAGRAVLRLDRQEEAVRLAVRRHLLMSGVFHEGLVELERARCIVGRTDVEHTREVCEEISHDGLQKWKSPAHDRACQGRGERG